MESTELLVMSNRPQLTCATWHMHVPKSPTAAAVAHTAALARRQAEAVLWFTPYGCFLHKGSSRYHWPLVAARWARARFQS